MPLNDDLHKFCDTHIREIKYFIYGIGLAGAILVAKDLRLATKFCHVSEIPVRFVQSHVTLQGTVRSISSYGVLEVEHQPVFNLPFSRWVTSLRPNLEEPGLLSVELVGVDLTPKAVDWLTDKVLDKHIWFKLIHASKDAVFCSVYRKNSLLLKVNINQQLVKQGLAPVLRQDLSLLSQDVVTQKHLVKLVTAETNARHRRLGMWRELEGKEETVSVMRTVFRWLSDKLKERWRRKG
ncbi:protein C3orf33 homolog [Littorina saxatilis]|uniref:TNase-like domain-containing protein n=1 Tax=Littorina saxatilis TaxID=31220 RepID=A0AAN9AU49_9CAEN